MAQARNGTVEPATDGETGTETPGTDAPEKAKRSRGNRSYIVMPLPQELKERFEAEAKAKDVPVGPYVRDMLAGFLGIEIQMPTTARRSKYANDEERKNAQKARAQSRSATMKNLMAEFRKLQAGGLSPEEAVRQASANVATGATEPEPEPEPATA